MSEQAVVDAQVVEESDVPQPAGEIVPTAPAPALAVTPQVEAAELGKRLAVIKEAMTAEMQADVDYGRIPGTDKPTLLKPGAEKLSVLFQLDVQLTNEKRWEDGGHLTVISHGTVFHAPTGSRLGYGEGVCTTRERKYAYRKGQRVCPECGAEAIIKGKKEYGGGWLCFAKKGGCGTKWSDGDAAIESQSVEDVPNPDLPDLWNCVTPETRVLTRDLRWVPAGELATGDVLISVAEENHNEYGRPYEDAVVTVGGRFEADLYELRMQDGRLVRCNGEHRWLVKAVNGGVEWVTTAKLYEEMSEGRTGRPRKWRILSTGVPWEPEVTPEAGYLAGLLDADGSLDVRSVTEESIYHGVVVSFAQQRGGVLDRFVAGLNAREFEYSFYPHRNPKMRAPVVKVHVRGGFSEQIRLLGTIRPPRLLERWTDLVDLSRRRFEGGAVAVEEVTRVGRGELVRLGTTSHTYIAEGLVCHNTVVKMAEKRARVDAILAVTGASALFTQDVEDMQSSGGDGGAPAPAQAEQPASLGFASEGQRKLCERRLKEAGFDESGVAEVCDYLNSTFTGRRGGGISEAIDKLGDEGARQHTVEVLKREAQAFTQRISDEAEGTDVQPPAEDDDLPEF